MSTDRDVTRIVRSWLNEDRHEDADRVLGAVLDELDATPQRRSAWSAWRDRFMNSNFVRVGLVAAAVVVIAVIAFNLLPGSPAPGGEPTETPEPTATPSITPSAPPDGSLPLGPFVLAHPAGGPSITVTIPAPGWYGEQPNGGILIKNENADPPDGAGMIGPFFGELYVYGDPCRWSTTMPDTPATTVDEAVAALTAQASRDASAPVDITVDGYAGKSITLHVRDDAVFSECDDRTFASWAGGGDSLSTGPSRYHQGPGQIDELWILDVDGQLIVMDANYYAETPAEDLAELHAILESMTFE
ncbi:MAG: hypothetical protein AABM41_00430 [Chloroflexota bacterium]